MNISRKDILSFLLISIISFLLVSDLFFNRGQSATFDGPIHATNIAMVYKGLKEGDFPVSWFGGFANYGMPFGFIVQQLTPYLGSLFLFITNNVILSYNLVFLVGALLSSLLFYVFLRLYFSEEASFLGVTLFNFTSYRILNIYIRGDQPEFFASTLLPGLLLGIYLFEKKKKKKGLIILSIFTGLLLLTHPFMFVVYSFIYLPFIFLYIPKKKRLVRLLLLFSSFTLGILLAAYYILPLKYYIRYFYFGRSAHLVSNQFLGIKNYLSPQWFYFLNSDIFTRGHFVKLGIIESVVLFLGFVVIIKDKLYKRVQGEKEKILLFSVLSSFLIIFMTTHYSSFLYRNIPLLSDIQHPWRMLSALIFLPPMILAYLLDRFKKESYLLITLLVIICLRYPQLYGKNYTFYKNKHYFFTVRNLHSNVLNTVWTEATEDYPVKKNKAAIIEGKGRIISSKVSNSFRKYKVEAKQKIRMIDYTFYFPGWHVFVDGKDVPIQFQDPSYRGVITYYVPQGKHDITVKLTNTKVVILGKIITLASLIALLFFAFNLKHLKV